MRCDEKSAVLLETAIDLCEEVRNAVRPHLGCPASKDLAGTGASGDATFSIDEVAEGVVESFLERTGNIASYTEDRGLVAYGDPGYVFIVDPIDGTRPAAAGLESCCVSIAIAPYSPDIEESLTLGDVYVGVISEIKNRAVYSAVRGSGVRIELDGTVVSPALSDKQSLDTIFWTLGFRGRPAGPLITVLSELIDTSSVGGGVFDLGSATFCIVKVLTGEMDTYVDVGQRMADEVEAVRSEFLRIGNGAILNNYPYDLAAAVLIARESGAVVSDAYGRDIDDYPLVPRGGGGQLSSVVSANPVLHQKVIEKIESGMARLRADYSQ